MVEQIGKDSAIPSELLDTFETLNIEESINLAEDENFNNIETEDSSQLIHEKETSENQNQEINQANCLALTVRKNYNLTILKNIFTTSGRMSLKIALSTLVLNFLKMFF